MLVGNGQIFNSISLEQYLRWLIAGAMFIIIDFILVTNSDRGKLIIDYIFRAFAINSLLFAT